MRIAGRRSDGALHLALGGGLSVILRGDHASPPTDETRAMKMGPWYPADDSLAARQLTARRLERARVVTVTNLDMSFDEQRERVCCALRELYGMPGGGYGSMPMPMSMDLWIPTNGLGDDWVVFCKDGKHYVIGYSIAPNGKVAFEGTPEEVVQTWQTLVERAAEEWAEHQTGMEPPSEGGGMERSLKADKKAERKASWWKEFKASRAAMQKLSAKAGNYSETYAALAAAPAVKALAYEGPHPFSYCMDTVIPAMEKDGKGPDDPESFCAWWKGEQINATDMPGSLPNLSVRKR